MYGKHEAEAYQPHRSIRRRHLESSSRATNRTRVLSTDYLVVIVVVVIVMVVDYLISNKMRLILSMLPIGMLRNFCF